MLAPQWYGSLPILAACDAGKAVYCAAALDMEPEQAALIRQRVEESGIAFMAEFPRRQSPATLRLKELMATRLGPARLLFCHQRLVVNETANGLLRNRPSTSPATRELLELVDWCRYVVGREPESVIGIAHKNAAAAYGEDYRMLSLNFPQENSNDSVVAQISCGHYMPAHWKEAASFRSPAGLQVCCENGIAFVDLPSNLVWFDSAGRHQESLERDRPVGEVMLSQFHRAVTSLVRRRHDLEDAYRALDVVLKAATKLKDGTTDQPGPGRYCLIRRRALARCQLLWATTELASVEPCSSPARNCARQRNYPARPVVDSIRTTGFQARRDRLTSIFRRAWKPVVRFRLPVCD